MSERPRGTGERSERPFFGWLDAGNAALLTDLYEITMLAAYHRRGMTEEATFEVFVRSLPETRRFLVVAGLESALAYLESVRFTPEGLAYLASTERFDAEFLAGLEAFRFTGEVWAMPEGEVAFAGEPIVRVTAPLPEAQLAETFLLNTLLFQTGVASKAARVTIAAEGRRWVDFSSRRDHGADAALKAARSAYVGGAAATSNVEAGRMYAIPVSGTMAHSFVMAFGDEAAAFDAFASEFPDEAVLLVDTYDVEGGVRNAIETGTRLAASGHRLRGVRLDSGDLGAQSRLARRLLDEAGLGDASVFASGDLDEHRIANLVRDGAPIDAFGVGTAMGTAAGAPALGGVYKLVEYAGTGRSKRSAGKETLPGPKQVWRAPGFQDVIEAADAPGIGDPLLRRVMRGGKAEPSESLEEIAARCASRLASLPGPLRELSPGPGFAPQIGPALRAAADR